MVLATGTLCRRSLGVVVVVYFLDKVHRKAVLEGVEHLDGSDTLVEKGPIDLGPARLVHVCLLVILRHSLLVVNVTDDTTTKHLETYRVLLRARVRGRSDRHASGVAVACSRSVQERRGGGHTSWTKA